MSDPTIWDIAMGGNPPEKFVPYADYARLKAEVERLQKLVGMQKSIDESIDAWIESKRDAAKEGKPSE